LTDTISIKITIGLETILFIKNLADRSYRVTVGHADLFGGKHLLAVVLGHRSNNRYLRLSEDQGEEDR